MRDKVIGPVTSATTGAAAVTAILCWAIGHAGLPVPAEIQGAITVVIVLVSGYLAPASGKRVAS